MPDGRIVNAPWRTPGEEVGAGAARKPILERAEGPGGRAIVETKLEHRLMPLPLLVRGAMARPAFSSTEGA
jgi:hypothetical protein